MATHLKALCFSYTLASVLLGLVLPPPADAQPPWPVCGDSGEFPQNSTYQSNLALAASIIRRKASSSPSLFASGRVGALPDMVYSLALCRGDVNAFTCAACVAVAFQDAQQSCAYAKDVTIYYELCYLRFSNRDFLAGAANDERYLPKVDNVSAPRAAFDAAVSALLNAKSDRAAADASRRFATAEEAFGGSVPAIYALAQCTPDMEESAIQMAQKLQREHDRVVHRGAMQLPVRAVPVLLRQPAAAAPGAAVATTCTPSRAGAGGPGASGEPSSSIAEYIKNEADNKEDSKWKMCSVRFTYLARSNGELPREEQARGRRLRYCIEGKAL